MGGAIGGAMGGALGTLEEEAAGFSSFDFFSFFFSFFSFLPAAPTAAADDAPPPFPPAALLMRATSASVTPRDRITILMTDAGFPLRSCSTKPRHCSRSSASATSEKVSPAVIVRWTSKRRE